MRVLTTRRTVCFLAFDGHCYMYRAVKRVKSGGASTPRNLREARRQLMAAGEYCGLRRGTRIRELPEEHEVLWRWCKALGQEYRTRLGAQDLPEAAEGKAESARRGGEQTLQALCGDCHSKESAQPTSLEWPPLVFEAQARAASRHKNALYVGVDVVRCRRNGLANFPLPILCPADGVEPPDLGFGAVRGARLVPKGFAGRDAGPGRWDHIVRAEPRGRGDGGERWSAWPSSA